LVDEADKEVDDFILTKFLVSKQSAEFRMGDLFDPKDYPEPETLRKKFYVKLDIDSVSDTFDIRLNKDAEILQQRVGRAVEGLWSKLALPLQHFAEKMDSDQIFRDSTVNNLKEIAALIPDLNFLGDEKLNDIHRQITNELTVYDAKDLRKDPDARAHAGKTAKQILDRMRGFVDEDEEF
jgi:hypothetical protein